MRLRRALLAVIVVVGGVVTLASPAGAATISVKSMLSQLSVRADVAGPHIRTLVLGYLVGLAAVTVGLGWLADADGARHPVTMASIVVAVAVVCGGPNLMAAVRRRSERTAPA